MGNILLAYWCGLFSQFTSRPKHSGKLYCFVQKPLFPKKACTFDKTWV